MNFGENTEQKKAKLYKYRWGILCVLMILFFLFFFFIEAGEYFGLSRPSGKPPVGGGYDSSDISTLTSPKSNSTSISISGFSELYVSDGQFVPLQNPEENDVVLMYRVYDGKDLIFESQAIAPGKEDRWYAFDALGWGDFELKFVVCKVVSENEIVNKLNFMATIHCK